MFSPSPFSSTSHPSAENEWVTVEMYLTGRVVDLGGRQEVHVHLVLTDTGKTIQVSATEQQLAAETAYKLYPEVTLRVQAEQHLHTRELRRIKLLEFLPHADEADEAALKRLWEKGREAWLDVPSATVWVESMRSV